VQVFVATVSGAFAHAGPPPALADALLAEPRVVTVRLGRGARRSVVRVDVHAEDAAAAADAAVALVAAAAAKAGATLAVSSASAVAESERDAQA
jgi:hypothetical protein